MPKAVKIYVQYVEAVNKVVGKFSMYLIFAMGGVLLFESIARTIFNQPHIWVVEIAQFLMAAYYLLGGGYSMIEVNTSPGWKGLKKATGFDAAEYLADFVLKTSH